MLKKFGRDVAIYGGADFVFRLVGFVVVPVYAHILTLEDFGAMALLTTTATLLGYFANLGINNAAHRFYFDADTAPEQRPLIVSTGLMQLLSTTVLVVGTSYLVLWIGREPLLRHYPFQWIWVVLVLANILPEQIAQYAMDAVRLRFSPWSFFAIALAKNVVGILLGLWLLVRWDLGLSGVFLGTLVGSVGAVPLGLWLIRNDLTLRISPWMRTAMFRYGYPFVFAAAAYWVFGSMDRWLLMEMSSAGQVGLFSIAFKFASVLTLVIGAFAQAWSPYAMRMRLEDPDYRTKYASVFSLWYFGLAVAGLFVSLFSPEVFMLLTPADYWSAAPVLSIAAAGVVLFGTTQITALGITLEKKTLLLTLGAWIAALVNVGANLVLVPRLGAIGAAFSTLLAYGSLTASFLYWTQKLHPIPLERSRLLYCTALVALAAGAPFLLPTQRVDLLTLSVKTMILLLAIAGALALHIVPLSLTRHVFAKVRG